MSQPARSYSHTQVGWWLLVALGGACVALAAMLGAAALRRESPQPTGFRIVIAAVLVVLVITTALLTTLTVGVTSERVTWRFGPGVIRFSLPLTEITSVAATRTPLWAGIGIHWIFTGWVYNVSGRGAVELTKRDGSKVWLGTDEPDALAAAIESARGASRLTAAASPGMAPR